MIPGIVKDTTVDHIQIRGTVCHKGGIPIRFQGHQRCTIEQGPGNRILRMGNGCHDVLKLLASHDPCKGSRDRRLDLYLDVFGLVRQTGQTFTRRIQTFLIAHMDFHGAVRIVVIPIADGALHGSLLRGCSFVRDNGFTNPRQRGRQGGSVGGILGIAPVREHPAAIDRQPAKAK